MAGYHLVDHGAQGIYVGAKVGHAFELFRGHVVGSAANIVAKIFFGTPHDGLIAQGQSEIGDFRRTAVGHDDVVRLDVPVHNAVSVGVVQAGCNFGGDLDGPFQFNFPPFPCSAVFQKVLALHILHHQSILPEFRNFQQMLDRHDVGVVKVFH